MLKNYKDNSFVKNINTNKKNKDNSIPKEVRNFLKNKPHLIIDRTVDSKQITTSSKNKSNTQTTFAVASNLSSCPRFNFKNITQKQIKNSVVGITKYTKKRNIFNYYGFYTPHIKQNFGLNWNKNILRKLNIHSKLNYIENSKNSNVALSEQSSYSFKDFSKNNVEFNKELRLSNFIEKDLKTQDLKRASFKNVLLSSTSSDLYPYIPNNKLFKSSYAWWFHQHFHTRHVPLRYLYWYHRRVFRTEAKNIFDAFGNQHVPSSLLRVSGYFRNRKSYLNSSSVSLRTNIQYNSRNITSSIFHEKTLILLLLLRNSLKSRRFFNVFNSKKSLELFLKASTVSNNIFLDNRSYKKGKAKKNKLKYHLNKFFVLLQNTLFNGQVISSFNYIKWRVYTNCTDFLCRRSLWDSISKELKFSLSSLSFLSNNNVRLINFYAPLTILNSYFLNVFKKSRFSVFSKVFNSLNSYNKTSSLPYFFHQDVAFNKFVLNLNNCQQVINKLAQSTTSSNLNLNNYYNMKYFNSKKQSLIHDVTKTFINLNSKDSNVYSNSKFITSSKVQNLTKVQINIKRNLRELKLRNQLSRTLHGRQHLYFRHTLNALSWRSVQKKTFLLFKINKGRWRQPKFYECLYHFDSRIFNLRKFLTSNAINILIKIKNLPFLKFKSGSWKIRINKLVDIALFLVKKYRLLNYKIKLKSNNKLVYSWKRNLFLIRWKLERLLPIIFSFKKFLLNKQNSLGLSVSRKGFFALSHNLNNNQFFNYLEIPSNFKGLKLLSVVSNNLSSNSNIFSSLLFKTDKLNLAYLALQNKKFRYLSLTPQKYTRTLFKNYTQFGYKSLQSLNILTKRLFFLNKNSSVLYRNNPRLYKIFKQFLKKHAILNVQKLKSFLNFSIKNSVMFQDKFWFSKIQNSVPRQVYYKESRKAFVRRLQVFILKNSFYCSKKANKKFVLARKWISPLTLFQIFKTSSLNLNTVSSQQVTIWSNIINNLFTPYSQRNPSLFPTINNLSISRILPSRRFILKSNLNATSDLYIKLIVDRKAFFICTRSTSTFNVALIDSISGQTLNFLYDQTIESLSYRNIVIDVLSSENQYSYQLTSQYIHKVSRNNKVLSNNRSIMSSWKLKNINPLQNDNVLNTSINIKKTLISKNFNSFPKIISSLNTLKVSVIKSDVFIRLVEPVQNNILNVFKHILLSNKYVNKTSYLKLAWTRPDISFEMPKWLFNNWTEDNKQLFCWDLLLKFWIYRLGHFDDVYFLRQNSPLNSWIKFGNIINNLNKPIVWDESSNSEHKDKNNLSKNQKNSLKKYFHGFINNEVNIIPLLQQLSKKYFLENKEQFLNFNNRFMFNKLLRVIANEGTIDEFLRHTKLEYLKAAMSLISKKKLVLSNFQQNLYPSIVHINYKKVSSKISKSMQSSINNSFNKVSISKFQFFRVEMPIRLFLYKMEKRKALLREKVLNAEIRKMQKNWIKIKKSKSKNNKLPRNHDHYLRQEYAKARRAENAYALGMFRKTYKNTIWRKRLRNYKYRFLSKNLKKVIEIKANQGDSWFNKNKAIGRLRSRSRWFKKRKKREFFTPVRVPKKSWTLSLRRFYSHKLILRKYIFRSLGNISWKQFYKIYDKTKRLQQNRIFNFINNVESRLDMFMLRLNFAKTPLFIHQLIRHGHVNVNHKPITFPQYKLKLNDHISLLIPNIDHKYYDRLYKKPYLCDGIQSTLKNAPIVRLSINAPARFFALLSIKRLLFARYKRIHYDLSKKNGGRVSLTYKGFQLPINSYLRLQFGFMYQVPISLEAIRGPLRLTNIVGYDIFEIIKYRNPR